MGLSIMKSLELPLQWYCKRYTEQNSTVKPVLSGHSKKKTKNAFQDRLSFNAGQVEEHSAIPSTCIKLPFVIKTFVLSIFEWPFKTGFTVLPKPQLKLRQLKEL